ncbi:MAG: Ribosome-binding factor A [Alphaproteobacteria bacterium MarineAlpha5_Bin11]|nr:ribosome-binding factor A [Pelagibacteraceae bacterium]PPR45151.1 MAG: Ribosome-binding factor A [Alphaproteobacteria bacterium MarineAlpha5_Bin11]PPR52123.1 MAG: Ribosome-binding factor A [Alphaproteobacteria bacterium MarineAlpha5_Bin10]|tara:strand:+ start:16785 stop:17150 length:366 start_codon:yes stop_codon:yes gene_type:complete
MKNFNELNQRQLRVGEQVRQIISECLLKNFIPDPTLIDVSITISMVKMSRDLKIAYVYFLPLGGNDCEEINEALNSNRFFFQKKIGKKIKTKFTPKVIFHLDDSFIEADKINNLLANSKIN